MTLEEYQSGQTILIDKPLNWTSFDVVNKLRYSIKKFFDIKKIKIGHAGTLDPLASGLLVVCTGKRTKSISEIQNSDKEYLGQLKLGATTPSYDCETNEDAFFHTDHISEELIIDTAKKMIGKQSQIPPIFSAIKKDGKKLYDFARNNIAVDIPSREICISSFEISQIKMPFISFKVVCSKGTYVRSLANDFGKELKSGAYLTSLRRTRVGGFYIKDAIGIDEFIP
ncbi:tRNA pseudouridine(55) synthase TruB [Ichthyobacterium seriolicida]|uniref:tRNA pseudouridine(55) synthase TruB n=1 Tax=Ichthyobacterium seriolicida TaxID=242600 RepID=UPI000BBCE36B|nr:tRNA pseudouridine(55) synthase TruB [Ichthyobacterium seriolicida]